MSKLKVADNIKQNKEQTLNFSDLPLDARIQQVLVRKELSAPTQVQAQAIPHALMGKDLLVSSQTGSGKTLAFLLPALHRILTTKAISKKDPRVLILAPTRELAKQVFMQLKWLIANLPVNASLILGGENYNDQVKALRRNPQFVVGTAGRLADHLKDKSLFLNGLELLIFDEADRMLDLGFASQLTDINQTADHRKRQTLMFSATLDSAELHHLTRQMLKAPLRIAIGDAHQPHQDIQQRFYLADHIEHKETLLTKLINSENHRQIIVFTATRADASRIAQLLNQQQIPSVGLSAELSQSQRNHIMNSFSRGQQQVLVTTDVASRGLDLLKVSLVINFDMPKQADEYIHRIGRTGRAGNKGQAISCVGPKDWRSFEDLKQSLQQDITFNQVEGLAATFSGFGEKEKKATKTNTQSSQAQTKKKHQAPRPKSRIKTMQGAEVGHTPLKRKTPKQE